MLKDMNFADLILHADGTGYLKGVNKSRTPVPVSDSAREEIQGLARLISDRYAKGDREFRLEYGGVFYRVISYEGVEWGTGNVFFLRKTAESVPEFLDLGYPTILAEWLMRPEHNRGLVIFTGPQVSGKTTSAAAYISRRLREHGGHGISFEDPVEMPLDDGKHTQHFFYQTEIHDQRGFEENIKRSYRMSSPDIIYIGEIRDPFLARETLRVTLSSNQSLVVATIPAGNTREALERLLAMAREADGEAANNFLAQGLLAVICQELPVDDQGNRTLRLKEALVTPFSSSSVQIRARIQDGQLQLLDDDLRLQTANRDLNGEMPL